MHLNIEFLGLLVGTSISDSGFLHLLTVCRMPRNELRRNAKLVMAPVLCLVYAYAGAMLLVTKQGVAHVVALAS